MMATFAPQKAGRSSADFRDGIMHLRLACYSLLFNFTGISFVY